MAQCSRQIDVLREEVDKDIWTFRWLWLINLAAIIWGVTERHYDVVSIGGLSAAISLVGIGRTRRGRRLVDRVASLCFGIGPERIEHF